MGRPANNEWGELLIRVRAFRTSKTVDALHTPTKFFLPYVRVRARVMYTG